MAATPDPGDGLLGEVEAVVRALEAVETSVGRVPDGEFVPTVSRLEHAGRLLDELRVRAAGEVAVRCDRDAGGPSGTPHSELLSTRMGCRNEVELLERLTGVSAGSVRSRLRLASQTRAGSTLLGEVLPPRFPYVAAGVRAGLVGEDAAEGITSQLSAVGDRADPAAVLAAERELVAAVAGVDSDDLATAVDAAGPDPADTAVAVATVARLAGAGAFPAVTAGEVRVQAQVWRCVLDPDGVEPDAERAQRQRGITIGKERGGVFPLRGNLVAEVAAQLQRLIDAHENPARRPAFVDTDSRPGVDAGTDAGYGSRFDGAADVDAMGAGSNALAGASVGVGDAADPDPDEAPSWDGEVPVDPRTPAQRRHDALAAILGAAARSEDTPSLGGAAPTLVVTVTADELAAGTGAAHLDGIDLPVPVRIAERIACTGAVQKVVFDEHGRIIRLGSVERVFTPHQRRAITARDGGCIIPGCSIRASWCEIHHVTEHAKGGQTHTDNGVLVCWWHHHHLDESGWEIRMRRGVPEVREPGWYDTRRRWRPVSSSPTRITREQRARRRRSETRRAGPSGRSLRIRPLTWADLTAGALPDTGW